MLERVIAFCLVVAALVVVALAAKDPGEAEAPLPALQESDAAGPAELSGPMAAEEAAAESRARDGRRPLIPFGGGS